MFAKAEKTASTFFCRCQDIEILRQKNMTEIGSLGFSVKMLT